MSRSFTLSSELGDRAGDGFARSIRPVFWSHHSIERRRLHHLHLRGSLDGSLTFRCPNALGRSVFRW